MFRFRKNKIVLKDVLIGASIGLAISSNPKLQESIIDIINVIKREVQQENEKR